MEGGGGVVGVQAQQSERYVCVYVCVCVGGEVRGRGGEGMERSKALHPPD